MFLPYIQGYIINSFINYEKDNYTRKLLNVIRGWGGGGGGPSYWGMQNTFLIV